MDKGSEAYKAGLTESRQASPTKGRRSPALGTLKNTTPLLNGISTMKSTSTISEIIHGKNQLKSSMKNMRSDFGLFDSKELGTVEFEEELESRANKVNYDDDEESEESEPSWQKKSGSGDDSSDSFRKPVDFGIDKDISTKLDKLNVKLMVSKEKELQQLNRASLESMPTISRDQPDSVGRAYSKAVLGLRDEEIDLKKSGESVVESTRQSLGSSQNKSEPEHQKDLTTFQQSLDREFDQKRLELLENKDTRVKKLKEEIEQDLIRLSEVEKKRIIKAQDEKLK